MELQYFVHLMRKIDSLEKTLMLEKIEGKDWRQEKVATEKEMAVWPHQLNGCEFEQTLGDREEQGSLASCSPGSQRVRHDLATEQKRQCVTESLCEEINTTL